MGYAAEAATLVVGLRIERSQRTNQVLRVYKAQRHIPCYRQKSGFPRIGYLALSRIRYRHRDCSRQSENFEPTEIGTQRVNRTLPVAL